MIELCLSFSNGKKMLYNEISFYMLFLEIVCNEALWQSEHPSFDHSSTPADQHVKSLLTLQIQLLHPLTGSPYSTVHHISSVCVDVFFVLLSLWELDLCPNSIWFTNCIQYRLYANCPLPFRQLLFTSCCPTHFLHLQSEGRSVIFFQFSTSSMIKQLHYSEQMVFPETVLHPSTIIDW